MGAKYRSTVCCRSAVTCVDGVSNGGQTAAVSPPSLTNCCGFSTHSPLGGPGPHPAACSTRYACARTLQPSVSLLPASPHWHPAPDAHTVSSVAGVPRARARVLVLVGWWWGQTPGHPPLDAVRRGVRRGALRGAPAGAPPPLLAGSHPRARAALRPRHYSSDMPVPASGGRCWCFLAPSQPQSATTTLQRFQKRDAP